MYAYYIFFKWFSMNNIFSAWSLSVVINLSKWYLFVCESYSILLFASGCTLEIMRYSLANHTYSLFFPWPGEAGVLLPGRMSLTAWPETLAPWSHELNCMTWKGYLLVNWSSHDSFLLMSSFMKSWHSVVTKLGLPTHKLTITWPFLLMSGFVKSLTPYSHERELFHGAFSTLMDVPCWCYWWERGLEEEEDDEMILIGIKMLLPKEIYRWFILKKHSLLYYTLISLYVMSINMWRKKRTRPFVAMPGHV